ncbi:MAG TPA: hypothetical protein VIY27_11245 [Myxococcota bacterium]
MELDTLCESCGEALLEEDAVTCKHCDLEGLCATCVAPAEHDCPFDPSPTSEWDDDAEPGAARVV